MSIIINLKKLEKLKCHDYTYIQDEDNSLKIYDQKFTIMTIVLEILTEIFVHGELD